MVPPLRTEPRISAQVSEEAFDLWLANAKTVWLACRIQGHWWPDYNTLNRGGRIGAREGGYMLDMSCDRGCGVQRRASLTTEFGIMRHGNSYQYPPGYQLRETAGGGWQMDKARRARIRQELAVRAEVEGAA
jgi:hypothetical protein